MNLIQIFSVKGELLYEGKAKSKKAFVQQLITDGKSLEGADLSYMDLTSINMDGGKFSGANLDRADLRGARAKHGSFANASLRGVIAMGFMAKHANFTGANFEKSEPDQISSRFDGAILQNSRFDGAICEGTSFIWAGLSGSTFVGAKLEKCDMTKAYMHNVDWVNATVKECNLSEADLSPTYQIAEKHIPDRTIGSQIIGNRYRHTKIGTGNSGFKKDSIWGRSLHYAYGGVAALAIAGAGMYLPLEINFEEIRHFIGQSSWEFIGVASALVVAKDRIEEFFKDGFTEFASNTTSKVRAVLQEIADRGIGLKNVAVAITAGAGGESLKRALKHEGGALATIRGNVTGTINIIVADRKHLAAALHRISDATEGRKPRSHDIIITRMNKDVVDAHTPSAMIFRRNGTIEAIWNQGNGKFASKKWDIAGVPYVSVDSELPQGPFNEHMLILKRFADMILMENNVLMFDFDPTTHTVHQGQDKSIVVVSRATTRLDNPWGPSIVTPDDECMYFRHGNQTDDKFKKLNLEIEETAISPNF